MSLCQNQKTSCGACCGIFNLDLDKNSIHKLLKNRTNDFKSNVTYSQKKTVINYRERNEDLESEIPKKDPFVYNCPYLGFIDLNEKKIGCMIHPVLTGDEKSQNYSFYGASICSVYDCKNKEERSWLEILLSKMNLDYYEYSAIASNHLFLSKIQNLFIENDLEINPEHEKQNQFFKILFIEYLQNIKNHCTSFELEMEVKENPDRKKELLDYFLIKSRDKIKNEIENFF